MNNDVLYQKKLMEYYRNEHHRGLVEPSCFVSSDENPSCGDSITFSGSIGHKCIACLKYQGRGCVLCQATASMLVERCSGITVDAALQITQEDILNMVGIMLGPTRKKCVLLPFLVLRNGLMAWLKHHEKV